MSKQSEDTNERTIIGLLGTSALVGVFVIGSISEYLGGGLIVAGLAYWAYLEPHAAMTVGLFVLAGLAVCLIITAIVTVIGLTILLFTEYNPIKDIDFGAEQ